MWVTGVNLVANNELLCILIFQLVSQQFSQQKCLKLLVIPIDTTHLLNINTLPVSQSVFFKPVYCMYFFYYFHSSIFKSTFNTSGFSNRRLLDTD